MFRSIYITFLNSTTLVHNCCISYMTHSKLLVLETRSTPLHVSLLPASPDTHLLSACDDGLYVFDIQLSKNTQKRFEFSISSDIIIPLLINLCGKEKGFFIEIYFAFFQKWGDGGFVSNLQEKRQEKHLPDYWWTELPLRWYSRWVNNKKSTGLVDQRIHLIMYILHIKVDYYWWIIIITLILVFNYVFKRLIIIVVVVVIIHSIYII